jgi:hypothetical protein
MAGISIESLKSVSLALSIRDKVNYTYKGFVNIGGTLKLHFVDEDLGIARTFSPDEVTSVLDEVIVC